MLCLRLAHVHCPPPARVSLDPCPATEPMPPPETLPTTAGSAAQALGPVRKLRAEETDDFSITYSKGDEVIEG